MFHQGFQTPRNSKSTRPAASCFHLFLGVWNSHSFLIYYFGDFTPALLDVSFGVIFRNSSGTNHREKCPEKHFYAGTLLNTNADTLSLHNLMSYCFHFFFHFLIKNLKFFVILYFKGHDISLSRRAALLSFQNIV